MKNQLTAATLAAILMAGAGLLARAEVPEPDNILYGTILLDGVPVTATNTNVVVEARFQMDGPALDTYRMGSDAKLGNVFYALRPDMETAPQAGTNTVVKGDTLFIVLSDQTGQRDVKTHSVSDRGVVARIDFGASFDTEDLNANGIPDAWEATYLAGLGDGGDGDRTPEGDFDLDGVSNLGEYLGGTDPKDEEDYFAVAIESNVNPVVRFTALPASGLGYEGKQRFYALESSSNLVGHFWTNVAAYERIAGSGQIVAYPMPGTNLLENYRGRVWLE
ncbi:MAG TPA: hypothetical protein DCM68_01600 [Verrucomicrobia bacterium]|nr:hypothetical protein [Verrucomicrobiota bacterium]